MLLLDDVSDVDPADYTLALHQLADEGTRLYTCYDRGDGGQRGRVSLHRAREHSGPSYSGRRVHRTWEAQLSYNLMSCNLK